MAVLKWLFQPVYLLLIIVIVALYVNREAIFPDEVAESLEAEALVGKVDALVGRLSADVEQVMQPVPDVTESPDAPLEVAESEMVAAVSDEIASPPAEEPASPIIDESVPVVEVAPVSSEPQPVAPQGEVVAPAETQSVPEALREDTAVTSVASPLATWRAARAAVWQGDLHGAVAHYRQLIAQQPDNYDAYGEMGNALLAQSEVDAAVEAYTTAARLIHQSGNQQMARRLVGTVATLDEAQGRALYNEFSQ